MEDLHLLGVVESTPDGPRIAYLNETVPVTGELLGQAAPAPVSRIFRLTGRCETSRCVHFSGERCNLAARIVQILPAVVDALPVCLIRSTCRWFQQEGPPACMRCPQIVTESAEASEEYRQAALPPP